MERRILEMNIAQKNKQRLMWTSERQKPRKRKRETERQRQRETETDRETERDTERHRERQRHRKKEREFRHMPNKVKVNKKKYAT